MVIGSPFCHVYLLGSVTARSRNLDDTHHLADIWHKYAHVKTNANRKNNYLAVDFRFILFKFPVSMSLSAEA
jgi:hypothetical protein